MRKLFLVTLIIVATFSAALAQQQGNAPQNTENSIPNMGRAPEEPNGIGRLDLRVVDEDGNPVKGVRADLESRYSRKRQSDKMLCESWNFTDARGVAVLPPLHMGRLKLKLEASGFQTQTIEVAASNLNEPVRVTMMRKK